MIGIPPDHVYHSEGHNSNRVTCQEELHDDVSPFFKAFSRFPKPSIALFLLMFAGETCKRLHFGNPLQYALLQLSRS